MNRRLAPSIMVPWSLATCAFLFAPNQASAIPQFARRYNLKCFACHTIVPVLNEQGALSPDVVRTTDAVSAALWSLDAECAAEYESTGAITAFTEEGIRSDPRWEAIRGLASEALTAFRELGIPTPKLSDEDFNRPREDAP